MGLEEFSNCTIANVVSAEKVDMIEYLCNKGCEPDEQAIEISLYNRFSDIIRFFHERGYDLHISTKIKYLHINNESIQYYHDNAMDHEECRVDCKYCTNMKLSYLWESWMLESYNFQSYNQWFPRERDNGDASRDLH